jgi:subtilisin family serine protease
MTSMLRTAVALALAACAQDGPVESGIRPLAPDEKIDGPLRTAAASGVRVPVFILGAAQLLASPGALDAFAASQRSADRLELRRTVVADLKRIADEHRAALADADWPPEARALPFWIVNGVAALLTLEEIERAAARTDVAYLYLMGALPPQARSVSATVVSPVRGAFTAAGKRVGWNLERIGAPAVWEAGVTGESVVVALIDDALDLANADLVGNIWVNDDEVPNNGLDDDRNGYVDDRHGYDFARGSPDRGNPSGIHGTTVAGIIAGDGSGGVVTGVAPAARIMSLGGISFADVALAYQYALENGADVVNMSFSLPNLLNVRGLWRMASDHAVAAGLVLVSGAGNFQLSAPVPVQLRVPEDIPSVIAVGGVDEDRVLAPFSSTGPVEWGTVQFFGDHALPAGLVKPDLVAFPGPGYPLLNASGAGYIESTAGPRGNSFSGPHAAGAAALVLSASPRTPAWRVAEILRATARDIDPAGKDNRTGAGLIDVEAAVRSVR